MSARGGQLALLPQLLQGVPLAQLPSEAGSKRSQPEYPTQEDVAAAPLKRIKPNETPFAFNFQQPNQPSTEEPCSAGAHDQPFVFSAGAQSLGAASRQNSWRNLHGHEVHPGALPPSWSPTAAAAAGQSSAGNNPYMGLPFNPSSNPPGSMSSQSAGSLPHSMYPGFAPPANLLGHPGPTSHLAPNAAAAYGQDPFGMAYPYGMQPPSHPMAYPYGMHPGMHPSYAAYAAPAMPTQYPYPPQILAPYQQTPSLNTQPSSEIPPPPPPFPPV